MASNHLTGIGSESKQLATWYFTFAAIIFGAQLLFGLVAAIQYVMPGFLFELLDFSVARMLHINALVVWMVFAMFGSVYWLLPDETGIETIGIKIGKLLYWVFVAAIVVVILVYLFIQVGPADETSIWFIHEGREYIEAPRWADFGIVVVALGFVANLWLTGFKGKNSGIVTVLMADMIAFAGLYLAGMFFTDNITVDQYWWWWVIHLWVEATWEVFVGAIAAYGLITMIGAHRKVVEMWLWIEVAMLFGSGILGIGHHYFWIGTPEYWWEIGALFSALEPLPLVAMFIHVLYDWGKTQGAQDATGQEVSVINNKPAFTWFVLNAFGNFLGAGIWGFFHTLPQVNLYTHGTQFTSAHGHLAFFGAYATILIGMMYIAVQGTNGIKIMKNTRASLWAVSLIVGGVMGMTIALTIAGYVQVLVSRAQMGATWAGYFDGQSGMWFAQAMDWRLFMGAITFLGFLFLVKDLLSTGKNPVHER
ncbi:nitric-oxide reductase, large subunit [Sulfurimonas gotlandica GD1]|uniref:Nitric-oxide reductase, large subunit n=1 Tax=Sulfurimonas gotlandica (strain DSM 19862 / JCM 16533 / GD1) TaxID=929558 RepID=B6BHE4_SULGG|nr:cbb3-type cytochrome c oxidase subunit I [Sulfurimonas gotlandica]EDZ63129.1 nitric-oxide reductase subunit B [Sulfurimonas gotlandica GD1]EHP29938.1 nitric-oxide reductase, large subunit [Sulfurimonas gotlandica GD1]